MSGHSHYATIKRAKEAKDAAKGKVFSRHAKAIALAIKAGNSADPELNSKLRFAIEQAKADNMPKSNIDRILERASEAKALEEVVYEGFGPLGVGVMVMVATDNKNRAAQEIKNLFERVGGNLAGPGSVEFNFEKKGLVIVKKQADWDTQMLALIDQGAEDIEEGETEVEVYTPADRVAQVHEALSKAGQEVVSFAIVMRPKTFVEVREPSSAQKVLAFLETLENHEDVQAVYSNLDIPDTIAQQLT